MPREVPPPLSLTLMLLREARGWTQKALAAAADTARSVVVAYENGVRKELKRERLGALAAAMGYSAEEVDLAVLAVERFWSPAAPAGVAGIRAEPAAAEAAGARARPGAGGPAGAAAGRAAAEEPAVRADPAPAERRRARLAAARLGMEVAELAEWHLVEAACARRVRQARAKALRRWNLLRRLTAAERWLLVETLPDFQGAAICERLCAESERAAADDAERALELASLALRAAELAGGEDAQGYAWGFVGNARRVAGDLAGAEAAFGRAWELWRAGGGADGGLLGEWRLLDLEASLRRDLRQWGAALELLDRARAAAPREAWGRILLKRAFTLEQAGEVAAAVAALREAAPLIHGADDARLPCVLRFNLIANLCHLGRYVEAEPLLPEVREMAAAMGNKLDLFRVLWLTGRVAAGRGRREEGRAALGQARREFAARGNDYDVALVSLELAVLELEDGHMAAVRRLAREMVPVFGRHRVHREAVAALQLFCRAAEAETANAELARRLVGYLERARHDPRLRFEEVA